MQFITLSNGLVTKVDDEDYEMLSQVPWTAQWNRQRTKHYAVRRERIGPTRKDRKQIAEFMHRIIMDPPKGLFVAHKNGDTLDDRRANLRIVTNRQNSLNNHRVRNGGAHRYRGRWRAQIGRHVKTLHLGYFDNQEEALARVAAFRVSVRGQPETS